MVTILTISTVFSVIGFILGNITKKKIKVIEIFDFIKPVKGKRPDVLRHQDAVMQLKNEIAASGAIRFSILEDGTEKVSLKLVID